MTQFDWSKAAEKQWDERADGWNARSREMWEAGSRKDITPLFLKYLKPHSKVCDLGCGDGYGALKLAKANMNVTGIDVAEEMIDKAKAINEGYTSTFLKGDIASLPFADDCFDGILAINSLEWTEDPYRVLEEVKRVLKRDAYACIGILGPTAGPRENSYSRLLGKKVICNTMMPWEFEKISLALGFEKVDELGVYKKAADLLPKGALPLELKQSLSFMWVFILKNRGVRL